MTKCTLVELTGKLQPHLTKCVTRLRMPIPVDLLLAVTIWRLAAIV